MSLVEVRDFLARHGLAAHRDRGQNFLTDESLARVLVDLAGVGPEEKVIEVGTGLGMLTCILAERANQVMTIEIDRGLVRALKAEGLPPNVVLQHADAREVDFSQLARDLGGNVKIVANLPYSVGTPLLRELLNAADSIVGWSVMLQREVARRVVAGTGEAEYGSLSVLHELVVEVEAKKQVRAGNFYPKPKVDSTFLVMRPKTPAIPGDELRRVEKVTRGAFKYRRKTLHNSLLRSGFSPEDVSKALVTCRIDARVRPERISPPLWRMLASELPKGKKEG
jgi:16S rRNA (adenine1518-N6/adenine1519-N6)-dimethyltransferase